MVIALLTAIACEVVKVKLFEDTVTAPDSATAEPLFNMVGERAVREEVSSGKTTTN